MLLVELTSKNVHQSGVEVGQTDEREQETKEKVDQSFVDDEVEPARSHVAVVQSRLDSRQTVVRLFYDIVLEERRDVVDDRQQNDYRQHLSANQITRRSF